MRRRHIDEVINIESTGARVADHVTLRGGALSSIEGSGGTARPMRMMMAI